MTLTTARLTLRPFSSRDVGELHALFIAPEVRRFLLDDHIVDRGWMADEIAESDRRFAESGAGLWSIRTAGAPKIVGFAGFRPFFDPPRLQLLYGLLPDVWGRGFAREAAERVCRYAVDELGFAKIEAATDVPNVRSARVLEALGFEVQRTTEDGTAGTTFWRRDVKPDRRGDDRAT